MGSNDTLSKPRSLQESPVVETDARPTAVFDVGASELPTDAVFTLLKNERRRRVLERLDQVGGPVALGTLAEEIAAQENGSTAASVGSTERKRVYVALYQCHLPKLADAGVVEYDRRGGRVELTDAAQDVLVMARRRPNPARPWHRYYGGVGSGAAFLFVANYLDLLPVQLAANVFSAAVVAALLVLSTVHGIASRRRSTDE
jgi:DNA-binding transcriptional ArsR family regulator